LLIFLHDLNWRSRKVTPLLVASKTSAGKFMCYVPTKGTLDTDFVSWWTLSFEGLICLLHVRVAAVNLVHWGYSFSMVWRSFLEGTELSLSLLLFLSFLWFSYSCTWFLIEWFSRFFIGNRAINKDLEISPSTKERSYVKSSGNCLIGEGTISLNLSLISLSKDTNTSNSYAGYKNLTLST
jgi:hypothetical protein